MHGVTGSSHFQQEQHPERNGLGQDSQFDIPWYTIDQEAAMLLETTYEISTIHNMLCCADRGSHIDNYGREWWHHERDCFQITRATVRSERDEEWINSREGRGLGCKYVSTRDDDE